MSATIIDFATRRPVSLDLLVDWLVMNAETPYEPDDGRRCAELLRIYEDGAIGPTEFYEAALPLLADCAGCSPNLFITTLLF